MARREAAAKSVEQVADLPRAWQVGNLPYDLVRPLSARPPEAVLRQPAELRQPVRRPPMPPVVLPVVPGRRVDDRVGERDRGPAGVPDDDDDRVRTLERAELVAAGDDERAGAADRPVLVAPLSPVTVAV